MVPSPEDGPIVVIKEEGPGKRCRNREWEWFSALNMISISAAIFLTPTTVERGAFRYLIQFTWVNADRLWIFYLVVGVIRMIALILNGRVPVYGPHIRALGCVAGALIWSAMTMSLIRLTEDTLTLSIGIGCWGWATVFELRALHRALMDVGHR